MVDAVKKYLSYIPRTPVWTGIVLVAPRQDPLSKSYYSVAFTGMTGDPLLVEPGMTLDVGTTPYARDICSLRVRKEIAGDQLFIGEVAPAEAPILAGHYLTVRNEFRLWQIMPRLTGVLNSSGYTVGFNEYDNFDEVYYNQNKVIKPIVNVEYKRAGWVDKDHSYRTVEFSLTYFIMTIGESLNSISWDIGDATLVSGFLSGADITLQLPSSQYFRYISVTVADTGGAMLTRKLPVWVHSPDHPPITEFSISKDITDFGRSMDFEIFEDDWNSSAVDPLRGPIALEQVFKGHSPICYWEEPVNPAESFENTYRSEYIGFTARSQHKLIEDRSVYHIETLGPEDTLRLYGGFAQTINDKDNPSQWYEMEHVNVNRCIHYYLRRYTTFPVLFNIHLTSNDEWTKAESVAQSSIWEQISNLATAFMGNVACDSLGSLWVFVDYNTLEDDDRTARGVLIDLTPDAWEGEIDVAQEYLKSVGQESGDGSWYMGDVSSQVSSKAPGLAPSYGSIYSDGPYQRLPTDVDPQTELNRRLGMDFSRQNNPYPGFPISLIRNTDIFEPALNKPITLTWQKLTPEGWVMQSRPFMPTQVNIAHSNDRKSPSKKITLTLEGVTKGLPAQTYIPPKYPNDTTDPLIVGIPFPGIEGPPGGTLPDPPIARFSFLPPSPDTSTVVYFTDASVGSIVFWDWDFGDGTVGTAQNPMHTYPVAGTYAVSLKVTDARGATDSVTHNVVVTAAIIVLPPLPTRRAAMLFSNGTIQSSANIDATSPVWRTYSMAGHGGLASGFFRDGAHPGCAFYFGGPGVYRVSNLFSGSISDTLLKDFAADHWAGNWMSVSEDGRTIVVSGLEDNTFPPDHLDHYGWYGDALSVALSRDGGASWVHGLPKIGENWLRPVPVIVTHDGRLLVATTPHPWGFEVGAHYDGTVFEIGDDCVTASDIGPGTGEDEGEWGGAKPIPGVNATFIFGKGSGDNVKYSSGSITLINPVQTWETQPANPLVWFSVYMDGSWRRFVRTLDGGSTWAEISASWYTDHRTRVFPGDAEGATAIILAGGEVYYWNGTTVETRLGTGYSSSTLVPVDAYVEPVP